MITVKHILLLICIVFVGTHFSVHAKHRNEIKGVLVTASYDTLKGFIKKVPEKRLFENIKFRNSQDCDYVVYSPVQIEAFIADEFSLFSHVINLNNVNRYIFIKKIYEGDIDLYYSWLDNNSDLICNSNDLYFAGFEDGRIIHMQKRFLIRTLTAIFKDSDCTLQEIETDKFDYYYYKYNKLCHLFATYNECINPSLAMKTKPKKIRAFNP